MHCERGVGNWLQLASFLKLCEIVEQALQLCIRLSAVTLVERQLLGGVVVRRRSRTSLWKYGPTCPGEDRVLSYLVVGQGNRAYPLCCRLRFNAGACRWLIVDIGRHVGEQPFDSSNEEESRPRCWNLAYELKFWLLTLIAYSIAISSPYSHLSQVVTGG